jgi:opacity protein-like surface antigen
MKRIASFVVIFTVVIAAESFAQPAGWTLQFGVGGAAPTSDLSGRLTAGWDFNAGVGYRFAPWFVLMSEFNFAGMGIPDNVLADAQAPDGHGHIFSLNIEPQVRFPLISHFSGFVEGGGGWIRRNVAFTQPSVQEVDIADPFYGDFPTEVGTDIVLSSTTRNAFGGNVGGGISMPLADTGADLFLDVRYYYAPTSPRVTAMLPVMFGVRYTRGK